MQSIEGEESGILEGSAPRPEITDMTLDLSTESWWCEDGTDGSSLLLDGGIMAASPRMGQERWLILSAVCPETDLSRKLSQRPFVSLAARLDIPKGCSNPSS